MGNFVRFVLLLFVILAGLTVGVYRIKPRLLQEADAQLQYWYKKPYQNEHNAIKELPMPEGRKEAVRRLKASLKDLKETGVGDNRFLIWRSMTEMLSGHLNELGDHEGACDVLRKALKRDPHNLEMRADLVRSLARVGTPDALKEARTNLEFIRYRFPSWSLVAALELELAITEKDGAAIATALQRSNAHTRAELLEQWQVFLFPAEGQYTKSELTHAYLDTETGIAHLELDVDMPAGGSLERFRLDPVTKGNGIIRDWGVVLRDADGKELVRRSKRWDMTLRTEVLSDGSLELKGGVDPQWIMQFPELLASNARLSVEFWFRPDSSTPPQVTKVLDDPRVRAEFDARMSEMKGTGGQE